MPLSSVRLGSSPSAIPGTTPRRPFSYLCYSALTYRLSGSRCRVLNLETIELPPENAVAETDRLTIEVAYARSKLQDVERLTLLAERQLQSLLKPPTKRRSPSRAPRQPTVVVHKQLDWTSPENEVFIQTTRSNGTQRDKKRSLKPLPAVERVHVGITSPLTRNMRTQVLTADEEKELAVQIQRLMQIEKFRQEFQVLYRREPTWTELAKILETDPVKLEREHESGQEAKQTMIERNMRLVISIANKLKTPDCRVNDLVVEGAFGLIRAVEKFDPDKGYKFSTYAHWWIRQNINRSLSESSRVIKVPSSVSEIFQAVMRATERYLEQHGVPPTDEELCSKLRVSKKRLRAVKNAYRRCVSLDEPLRPGHNDSDSRADLVEDPKETTAEDSFAEKTMKQDLELVVSTLPEKEATILRLRYGLEDGHERTLEDIGQIFHVTRERVRQIEAKAMRKLRQRSGTLKEYLEPREQTLYRSVGAAHLKAL